MKQAIFGILAVIVILGGAVIFGKDDGESNGTPSHNFYGNEQSSVTVVEYGDFECPACGAIAPIFSQVKEEFKDQVKFEFRHFPLVQIHFNALAAHRAAQAAGNQGMFWEMHDILYERQASWKADVQASSPHGGAVASNNTPGPIFEGYAQELGLDLDRFKVDVASSETLATINADRDQGNSDGANSTPTFMINGRKIEDTATVSTVAGFRELINQELGVESTEPPTVEPTADAHDAESTEPEESDGNDN